MGTALVTGVTGFVGREVARELGRAGWRIRALVREPAPEARAREAVGPDVALDVAVGDLRDGAALARAPVDCDAVVHLGALVDPALQADAGEVDRVNHVATVELAARARDAGCRAFVFVSSIAAMTHGDGAYGRAKLQAERAIADLAGGSFRVVVLRPPTVYGPGERYNFLAWVRAVDRGWFRVIGAGDNTFPLCTTANLARACLASIEGRVPTGVHLVADADRYSVARVHRAIASALGRSAPRGRIPTRFAEAVGLANELVASVLPVPMVLTRARVRTLTADEPFEVGPLLAAGVRLDAPLEAAVRETVADYRRRGVLPPRQGAGR